MAALPFSWGTCGFPLRVMQLAALLRFHTLLTPVGCTTPAVGVYLGVGGVLVQLSCSPTWFLPCAGATPPSASSTLGFCTLDGCVSMSVSSLLVYSCGWVGGVFATSLGFLPCPRLFLRACGLRSLPSCWLPWGFSRSPGVCPSASLVAWVRLQPFPSFSGLLLLRLLAGVVGVLHPVSGCSSCSGV